MLKNTSFKKLTNKYKNNLLTLMITLERIFNKDANILYVCTHLTDDERTLKDILFYKKKIAIFIWTHGMITNFTEVLKTYMWPRNKYKHENLLNLQWDEINTIFFTSTPTNPDTIKELLLLKKSLNIKIASLVNINEMSEIRLCKENTNVENNVDLIDFPIYFTETKNNLNNKESNTFLKKCDIYHFILRYIKLDN